MYGFLSWDLWGTLYKLKNLFPTKLKHYLLVLYTWYCREKHTLQEKKKRNYIYFFPIPEEREREIEKKGKNNIHGIGLPSPSCKMCSSHSIVLILHDTCRKNLDTFFLLSCFNHAIFARLTRNHLLPARGTTSHWPLTLLSERSRWCIPHVVKADLGRRKGWAGQMLIKTPPVPAWPARPRPSCPSDVPSPGPARLWYGNKGGIDKQYVAMGNKSRGSETYKGKDESSVQEKHNQRTRQQR